jgi:hypothetical protein
MCSFFIFEKRDFQSRLSQGDVLKFVEVIHLPANVLLLESICQGKKAGPGAKFGRICSCGKLPCRLDLFRDGLSEPIYVCGGEIQLSHLLLQRHALHQIVDPYIDRLTGVKVRRF